MTVRKLDRNRTVWQRLQDALEPLVGRSEADSLATHLLPFVVAERADARAGHVATPLRAPRLKTTDFPLAG